MRLDDETPGTRRLYAESRQEVCTRTDRMFLWLLVFQWLIALLLGQLGIDPVLVVRTVKENWKNVLAPAIEAAISRRARAGNHVYLVLRPRLMSGGGLQISWFERHSPIGGGIDNLPDAADKEFPGMQTWCCAIDLTPFASNLDMLFS